MISDALLSENFMMVILCMTFTVHKGGLYHLTTRNREKCKSMTCPSHKIYRVEVVDLKLPIIFKITNFVNMLNCGNFVKINILLITIWLSFKS